MPLLVLLLLSCESDPKALDSESDSAPSADADGDGFSEAEGDCDDGDASVAPGEVEVCDGRDNNCDAAIDEGLGETFYDDIDGDGFGELSTGVLACEGQGVTNGLDCNDADDTIHPSAAEVCDELDNDCDGVTDDGVTVQVWVDGDGDGYGDPGAPEEACGAEPGLVQDDTDCDDDDQDFHPGAPELDCADPNDYNCDGSTGFADADADGWAACEECDDAVASVNPDASELCDDVDNDCDLSIDEEGSADAGIWYLDYDGDGYGTTRFIAIGCEAPAEYVGTSSDCDDTEVDVYPGAPEVCDAADNDCDGTVDESADADGDGVEACDDCDDANASVYPSATEWCNGVDDDCDGTVDEADAANAIDWYIDYDSDGYGSTRFSQTSCDAPSGYVDNAADCDDTDGDVSPAASEVCNGVDDDCDGVADSGTAGGTDWYADGDGDGYGDPASSTLACDAPAGSVADSTDCDDGDSAISPAAPEVCNGVDDDCDGVVDSTAACGCATETYAGNGHTYQFCTTTSNWPAASAACASGGYHLATMADAAENSWITSMANTHITGSDPWFGYNDTASEGSWVWETGEAVSFTSWASGEPNNLGDEDCAHLYDSGLWNDALCSASFGYICESG